MILVWYSICINQFGLFILRLGLCSESCAHRFHHGNLNLLHTPTQSCGRPKTRIANVSILGSNASELGMQDPRVRNCVSGIRWYQCLLLELSNCLSGMPKWPWHWSFSATLLECVCAGIHKSCAFAISVRALYGTARACHTRDGWRAARENRFPTQATLGVGTECVTPDLAQSIPAGRVSVYQVRYTVIFFVSWQSTQWKQWL